MQLPSFLDLATIGAIAALVGMLIQYVKDYVPDYLIKPYLQCILGIALSYTVAIYGTPGGTAVNWVYVIVNGILAGIMADTGYQFFSARRSTPFSLPSRSESGQK